MKIAFLTLGCKLNYAETSTYERGFSANGLEIVPWEEKADVYLINTCSVTERAEKKCRNVIRKMHRTAPEAKIVVTGCYAELRREDLSRIEGVSLVFGAKDKSQVVGRTMAMLRGEEMGSEGSFKQLSMAAEYKEISKETLSAFSTEGRTRSFLKVQDGCNNFCAYCTVPYARGDSRNIPIAEVVSQAEQIGRSPRDCPHGSEHRGFRAHDRRKVPRPPEKAQRRRRHRKIQDFIDRAESDHLGDNRLDRLRDKVPASFPHSSADRFGHASEKGREEIQHGFLRGKD